MKTYKQVYIAIDLHSNSSTIGYMNQEGKYIAQHQIQTTPVNLINQVVAIPGEYKSLTLEQCNMAFSATEQLEAAKDRAKQRFIQTGEAFWEIDEFAKIPGIGPVGSHRFSGYIQTPFRFQRSGQLIKFCSLAVRTFTSDGRKVRSERLSKAGHGCLKNVAHTGWKEFGQV